MKCVIPAKDSSERIPHKNWIEFHDGKSLVERTIDKLLQAEVKENDIYVSCENSQRLEILNSIYPLINPLLRPPGFTENNVLLTDWIQTICGQVPGADDIAWCQVCDPLFNEYKKVFTQWKNCAGNSSLTVIYKLRQYLLSTDNKPLGWGFGEKHIPSQRLPEFGIMPFTLSVLTRKSIKETGYHIGRNPCWYIAKGKCLDIDTIHDFKVAQAYIKTLEKI